jgi:hypothetical protein
LILREPTYKEREVGFMVYIVKLGHVPSLKRRFHGEIKKAAMRAGLKSNTPNNFWLLELG